MKKLITITMLMALAISGFAQQFHFSAVCESGQTLYYRITDAEAHTVILTHPFSENNLWFQGNYYEGHVKPAGEIIIPSVVTYNGTDYTVTAIDSNTFFECDITSVFIPNSVIDIIPEAFRFSASLESITVDEENPVFYSESNALIRRADKALVAGCKATTIPDGIETICVSAFAGTGDGGDLVIPNSVKTIEDFAFHYCGFSGSLTLSDSLENIGIMAFYVSQFTGSLTIPDMVTEIKHHTFFKCQFTGALTLSSSLVTVDTCAFADTHFTGTLTIPNSMNFIGVVAFGGTKFSELNLGESVTTIAADAFRGCDRLSGVLRLPASLTEIDKWAFKWTSFDEIYSPNRIPPTLAANAFEGYNADIPIHIPFGCTEVYQNTEGWNYFSNFIEELPIIYRDFEPDSILIYWHKLGPVWIDLDVDGEADDLMMLMCVNYDICYPELISGDWDNTKICYFESNDPDMILSEVAEEDWLNYVSWNAGPTAARYTHYGFRIQQEDGYYYGWFETYDRYVNSTTAHFGFDRTAYCTIPNYPLRWGQTSFEVPSSPFAVGDLLYEAISIQPFCVSVAGHVDGQAAQGELVIPETVQYQGLSYTVTEIGEQAFAYCTQLSGNLVIPNTVTHIARLAFAACPLDSIFIPSSVTSIAVTDSCGGGAFLGCKHLQSIIVDEANPAYDSRDNCNALIETASNTLLLGCKNTIIPYTVNNIGMCAFAGCTELDAITIPYSVERLEEKAFYGCNSLSSITLPSSVSYIGDFALGCSGLASITCKSAIPPTAYYEPGPEVYYHSFWGVDSEIPIHVPSGCAETYQNAPGWNYFSNFIEKVAVVYTEFEGDTCQFFMDVPEEGFRLDLDGDAVCDFVTIGGVIDAVSPMTIGFRVIGSEWELTPCFGSSQVPDTTAGPGGLLSSLEQYNDAQLDTISLWYDSYWWAPIVFAHPIVDTTISHLMYGFRREIPSNDAEKHYCYGWLECSNRWNYYSPGKGAQRSQFTQAWLCVNSMAYCTIPDYPLHVGQTSLDDIVGEECAEWYYEIQNLDGSITYQHLECVGDTLFEGGKRPKIIIRSNTQYDKDSHTEVTHEYIYEENGKMYWWNKDLQEFTTLYDLTADTGDEWEIKVGDESLIMHVDAVEYIEYEGEVYRMLRVSDPNDFFSGDIICGIGHLTSFFPERLMNPAKSYRVEGMRCYWVDGELAFKIGDEDCDAIYAELHHGLDEQSDDAVFAVYPNPANNVLFVEMQCIASQPTPTYRITNLMGQTLLQGHITAETQQIDIEKLTGGMYFITIADETRKFVVK